MKEQEMMSMEDVVLLFASAGLAASLYAQYLYWGGRLVESPASDAQGGDSADAAARRSR